MVRKISNKKCESVEEKRRAISALGPAPEPPLERILVFQDPTYEGIFRGLKLGCPSQGLFADEGGLIVGGHAFNKDNELKSASGLSVLWDGGDKPKMAQ